MFPSDLARTVISLAAAAAIVTLPIIAAGVMIARLTHRRAPWLVPVTALLIGVVLGYALLASETAPVLRVASILGIAVTAGTTLVTGRLKTAGLVLIAASLPWTVYGGSYLLDGVFAGRRIDVAVILPPFLAGIGGIAVGIALIRFHRVYLARHPEAGTPAPPPTRAWNTAGRAAMGPSVAGLNVPILVSGIVLVAGTQATVVAGHGQPILEAVAVVVVGSIATGLATVLAWTLAWPPRSRRAFEAFAWLGEWELARFRDLSGGTIAPTVANMKRYVRNNAERPDDRWIRVEVLAVAGKLDAARQVAERIPDDTAIGRAERANYLAYLDWLAGGSGDPWELRGVVAAIEPADGDDRFRAEVALALAEVRRLVAAGDADPAAPLREVRERIGRRADRILFAAARRLASSFIEVATAFVVVVTLIDRATSI